MNPFTYKAHPILLEWIGLLTQSSSNPGHDVRQVVLLLVFTTPFFGLALRHITHQLDEISLPALKSLGLALPSAILYPH